MTTVNIYVKLTLIAFTKDYIFLECVPRGNTHEVFKGSRGRESYNY